MPDQFQVESQVEEGEGWWSRWLKMSGKARYKEDENQEEEKNQQFMRKMPKFKELDQKFEFTPEEIIMFYV